MLTSHRRRHFGPLLSVFLFVAVLVTGLILVLDSAAQVDSFDLQANPTETPAGPGGFQVNPIAEPTEELPIRTNPTIEPTEELPIRTNPTKIPDRPTQPPVIDDIETHPVTGMVRVIKRDCPMGVVEDALLTDYLTICTQQHDGVEFVVNDVDGAQAGVTANGQVEWTGVDPGVFNITETLPAGYIDPIVFCGYTESPGGGVQHPSQQDATGGVVAGEFPNVLFEYVCYWMNIKQTTGGIGGPDAIAANPEGDGLSQLWLRKRTCPAGIDPNQDFAFYSSQCTAEMNGVSFTLTSDGGSSSKTIESGEAIWTGLPLGSLSLEEDIPVGYGDPVAFCAWTAFYQGVFYDAIFAQPVSAAGGVMSGEISIPNTGYVCFMYNIPSGPGSLADPGYPSSDFDLRKWECPDGTTRSGDRDVYIRECQLATTSFEFTLTNADGSSTESTAGGWAHWSGLPTGPFTLEETIPEGYGSPMAFCGWYAEWDGYVYDAFPAPIPTTGGVIELEITIPNMTYFCEVFNMKGGIGDLQANPTEAPGIDDFQANPTAEAIVVYANPYACPEGIDPPENFQEAQDACVVSNPITGVEISVTAGGETQTFTTGPFGSMNFVSVMLDHGAEITIDETIPDGYGDPNVWCASLAGAEQGDHVSVESTDGTVVVTPVLLADPDEFFGHQFGCIYFHPVADGNGSSDTGGAEAINLGVASRPSGFAHRQWLLAA